MRKHIHPKLSIIIATYNTELIICKALESIIKQKFDNWECIIIDGLSSDKTISVVCDYMKIDSRISYISERDSGIYDAFNKGWHSATGEWVYYMGADDTILESGFESLFSQNINDYDIIYANVIYKTPIGLKYVKSNKNIDSIHHNLQCAHQGFMMKRSCIEANNGFNKNYHLCADYDLILRAYMNCAKVKYVDIDLAIFNVTGASGTTQMYQECYLIRKNNHSTSTLQNLYIYTKNVMRFKLRHLKYNIIKLIRNSNT